MGLNTKLYELSPDAAQDLKNIRAYIAKDNPDAADRLIEKIIKKFRQLERVPYGARPRPDLGKDIRSSPVGNYIVICRPFRENLKILRIFHASRNYPPLIQA